MVRETLLPVTNLGFPRMGSNRDLKKLVESYWAGKTTEQDLQSGAKNLRALHWKLQKDSGVSDGHIPSNDFSFYDHMLDMSFTFGVIPKEYTNIPTDLDTYFAMGRGLQRPTQGIDVPAQEMKKWFDTNYHFIVPSFSENTNFRIHSTKALDQFKEALELGIKTRPVFVGPVSYLFLGKAASDASSGFNTLSLLDKFLPVYAQLLRDLVDAGAEWFQLDEPVLSLDGNPDFEGAFTKAYNYLSQNVPDAKFLVASYFESLADNASLVAKLPVAAIHVDLIRGPQDLALIPLFASQDKIISLGLVNGRNIWKTDLNRVIEIVKQVLTKVDISRVWLAPSCSLLHSPHSLEPEVLMNPEIRNWLAFAVEKLQELRSVQWALVNPSLAEQDLAQNKAAVESRRTSPLIHDVAVQAEMKAITPEQFRRQSAFPVRHKKQQHRLNLPLFPTTTVGSFPQTKDVRVARQKFKKGEWNLEQYDAFIKEQIQKAVRFQEEVGLDMFVHGEFERNDMVEFFGENLKGYTFSQNGWVQSYGSRCVKPPIIFGDVSRPSPMTVETTKFAQSLTSKPMKGMLTGPITMLQWSFVRDDQPRRDTAFQIALALRKEVCDLESAGLPAIQIDEPAIREGLPLKSKDHREYLKWAVDAFLLSSTGVKDETQIHTHMCYSDFNDIFDSIKALDTDCITIENSKSDLKLLRAFDKYGFASGIGPGLYDIHSPRVPSVEEMKERLGSIGKYINKDLLWVNPDCGLKTRGWPETEAALKNMCDVASVYRTASMA